MDVVALKQNHLPQRIQSTVNNKMIIHQCTKWAWENEKDSAIVAEVKHKLEGSVENMEGTLTDEKILDWLFSVIMGGPDPSQEDEISISLWHIGLTALRHHFSQYLKDFNSRYLDPYSSFLHAVYCLNDNKLIGNNDHGSNHMDDKRDDGRDDKVEGTAPGDEDSDDYSQDSLGGNVKHPLLDTTGLYRMTPLAGSMHDVQPTLHGIQPPLSLLDGSPWSFSASHNLQQALFLVDRFPLPPLVALHDAQQMSALAVLSTTQAIALLAVLPDLVKTSIFFAPLFNCTIILLTPSFNCTSLLFAYSGGSVIEES
ncbi:hypothetical protein V8B97DRAFT_1920400 [Scleroderma yunnanense]